MFACIYSEKRAADISLKDFAYGFSPLVEETSINTVVIDVSGCELLFGSAYGLANEVVRRAATPNDAGGLGCTVNVALAGNPDAAIYAAKFFKGITFIAPGEELDSIGVLPIEQLQSTPNYDLKDPRAKIRAREEEEIIETLKRWGIRTFGEFARLPIAGLSERLGQRGIHLQQLASGKMDRHLKLTQAVPRFENALELDHPLTELEPLSFLLARLLNQICGNLHAYALATNELSLYLKLENGAVHERKLSLPHPMRDPRVFLRLILLDAEMHPPQSGVMAITIHCQPVKPRMLQSGLFIPLAPEPEKLELTLARLGKLVGPGNVGSLELLDTHRPDAFRIKRFALVEKKKVRNGKTNRQSAIGNRQSLGFRVFRPPLRALVQATQGFPTEISAWGSNRSVHGKVVQVAGPWRTTGDWWRLDRWARDEWDIAVESGSRLSTVGRQALYRIYRELREGTWFVEGVYD